jgi:hypothetical protein
VQALVVGRIPSTAGDQQHHHRRGEGEPPHDPMACSSVILPS